MTNYLLRHLQVFFYALGQLARAPFASFMTLSVIGITLALPSGFYLIIDNIQRISAGWDGKAQISVFLKPGTTETKAAALKAQLARMPEVAAVHYISPQEAMEEFKRVSGFGEALDALDHNPLPPVLVVRPRDQYADPVSLQTLTARFQAEGEVDLAQLDLEWVKRLQGILRLAKRAVWLLAVMLAAAVLLTVGNTIRLAILNRREEIEIIKLVGGTNAFIRRPFLYSGFLQGTLGAVLAWLLVQGTIAALSGPVAELASLYGSQFQVQALDGGASLLLLGGGALLGWLGSRLAVGRHLRAVEPR